MADLPAQVSSGRRRLARIPLSPIRVHRHAVVAGGLIVAALAGAIWWPVLPTSGAILAYAAAHLARSSLLPRLAKVRTHTRRLARLA
jgi:hypothetical protein